MNLATDDGELTQRGADVAQRWAKAVTAQFGAKAITERDISDKMRQVLAAGAEIAGVLTDILADPDLRADLAG
jgi:hypothetical protein